MNSDQEITEDETCVDCEHPYDECECDDESYNYDDWLADEGWWCVDCEVHTGIIGDYYMVHKHLWAEFGSDDGMLCIACLENRMGRTLTPDDFSDAPVNYGSLTYRSERMISRIGR